MPCPGYWVLFTRSLPLPEIRVTNSEGSEGCQGSPAIHKHSSYMYEELGILQFVTWHKDRERRQQFTLLISNDLKEAVIETFFSSSSDPFAPFRPETDSPHHVCAVMADVLHSHHLMKPPLFEPFLPFMNGVLNSALRKYATTDR